MEEQIPVANKPRVDVLMPGQKWLGIQAPRQSDYPDINPFVVWLVALLDDAFEVPGTGLRFGLDPIVGLIPGIGDALTAMFGYVVLHEAKRLGVSRWTRARMMWNYVLDTVVGMVPVFGDMFDVSFKANRKNLDLIQAHLNKKK